MEEKEKLEKESKGFNRTFMELKFCCKVCSPIFISCFNRTFMELKLRFAHVESDIIMF